MKYNAQKNFLYSIAGIVVSFTMGIILPRIYIANYGSEVNGLQNIVSQFVVCLSLFEAGVGDVTLQALYGPVAKFKKDKISEVISATNFYYKKTGIKYLITLLFGSIIAPRLIDSIVSDFEITCAFFLSGISNVVVFCYHGKYRILLRAEGKKYILTNLATATVVITDIAKIVLVFRGFNFISVLFVSFLFQTAQALYVRWYVKNHYGWLDLKAVPDFAAISQKNFALVHQISGLIFNNTDVLILAMVCDLRAVSVYSVYRMIIMHLEKILFILPDSINHILGQTYYRDVDEYAEKIDVFESVFSAISFALLSVTLYLYLPFMRLYTNGIKDANYIDELLPYFFVAIAMLTCMREPMLRTINIAGHFKQTTRQSILESVINVVITLLGVYKFGIYGVLLGTVVALLYRTNKIIIYANTVILKRKPWKTYCIYLLNLGAFVFTQWVFGLFSVSIDSYFSFFVVGLIMIFIVLVVFLAVQSCVLLNILKK